MKAIRIHARGGPQQLILEDAPDPVLRAGDSLVRVHGAGITRDELSWAETYRERDGTERMPAIPGHEVSGTIEETSISEDADFKVGDEVYGLVDFFRQGAAAELVAVPTRDLAFKPKSVDHAHAAAVPIAALTAWQALFEHMLLMPGQSILIHGASGGVGTFAVQLAKWKGARIFATASGEHADVLRDLGVSQVIDHRKERFEQRVQGIDAVLDTVGGDVLKRSFGVIRPRGVLVSVAQPVQAYVCAQHNIRGAYFVVRSDGQQLRGITSLIDEGHIQPMIAEVMPLSKARDAYELSYRSHRPGKIVISVEAWLAEQERQEQAVA